MYSLSFVKKYIIKYINLTERIATSGEHKRKVSEKKTDPEG